MSSEVHARLKLSQKKKKKKTTRIKFSSKINYSLKLQLPLKKMNITTYFKNLTVKLYVLYFFLIHMSKFVPIGYDNMIYKFIFYT